MKIAGGTRRTDTTPGRQARAAWTLISLPSEATPRLIGLGRGQSSFHCLFGAASRLQENADYDIQEETYTTYVSLAGQVDFEGMARVFV